MKKNDYHGHYKAFVKELKSRPVHTLQAYCQEEGIIWRRLYDWMRRHHISLKKLYQTYRPKSEAIAAIAGVCVSLPSGITVNLRRVN